MEHKEFLARAKELCAALSEDEKLGLLSTHHHAVERLGLGEFFIGTEVARGYVGREPEKVSTVFPQPVGLAATFDRELMRSLGEIAGREARAYYNENKRSGLCLWGPTVDPVRDPRWGRTEEAYGEDVFLAGELTAAYTLGMAGETEDGYYTSVPTLKHFCANNNEEDRAECDAYLPPRLRYEYYYAPFEYAIRFGGARSIMAAYNELNGVPAVMEPDLEEVLKRQWGLWFAVSDGGDFSQNVTAHHYTESFGKAYELSVKGGCDMMTDEDGMVRHAAESALEQGFVTWRSIDRAVMNALYARLRLGQTDKTPLDGIGKEVIDCEAHREVNRRAAAEQIVLLKNNGILPLKKGYKRIAILGPLADECLRDWYTGYFSYRTTVLSALRERFPDIGTTFDSLWDVVKIKAPNGRYIAIDSEGRAAATADEENAALFELQDWGENWCNFFSLEHRKYLRLCDDGIRLHNREVYDWFTRETFNLKKYGGGTLIEEFLGHSRVVVGEDGCLTVVKGTAVKPEMLFGVELFESGRHKAEVIAKNNDIVIYCSGNHPVQTAKECYDRKTLALNVQTGMTQVLAAANPDTVLAVISSYPYGIAEESEAAAAVLWSSHAGAELGNAVSDMLMGRTEPTGRLPLTWYRSELDLPDIHEYDIEKAHTTYMYFDGEPLYPFGYGLGYAEFAYSEPEILRTSEGLKASVMVENLSDRDGTDVVQVYFTVKNSAFSRPTKKLCGFERVSVPAHGSRMVMIDVPLHVLRVYDVRRREMIVEEGRYSFMFAASSADVRCECAVTVKGETIAPREDDFSAADFDTAESIRIRKLLSPTRECIYASGWSGKAVYGGLDFGGKTELVITASGVLGKTEVGLKIGGIESKVTVTASDRLDCFDEYTLPIPEGASGDTLEIMLPGGVRVSEIGLR